MEDFCLYAGILRLNDYVEQKNHKYSLSVFIAQPDAKWLQS